MIGTSLGPYRILEPLGSGGMGEVYLAEDTRLGRNVAIKVLPPEFAGDAARMARFSQEARAASAINHPGICTLHDIGDHEGQPFLVMEALRGHTLHRTIDGKPLPTDHLIGLAIQVAEALAEAHRKGVVHRDLKSVNIFVTDDGRTKILDFGLAKLVVDLAGGQMSSVPTSAPQGQLTREGSTLGTIGYMSPEQARGQTLDARSDLFSFGVVLYEMATGTLPFPGATDAVVFDRILNHDPPPAIEANPRLPTGLLRLIDRALQKDPADRFASAYEIKGQLEEIRRAPGSLDSILPTEHISSTAAVKPPPRPDETPSASATAAVVDGSAARESAAAETRSHQGPAPPAQLHLEAAPSPPPPAEKPSIGVLPFRSMSTDPEDEFFADGLSEEIINALTHLQGLDVAARTSAFSFKDKQQDIRRIGEALGVSTILEGSVRRAGSRLRVTAQLVNVGDGYHLWSERYDREMEDIFAIQDDITEAIVKVLEVHLVSGQSGEITRRATTSPEAYDLCLKGRHFWSQRTPQTMHKAIDYFERAIEIDPGCAVAHAGLADAHAMLGAYQIVPPPQAAAKAWEISERAIELDPTLSEPHFSRGFIRLWFSDDWPGGEPHFIRSLALDPSNSACLVYYGLLLAMAGRADEAVEQIIEAKRVDPLSSFIHSIGGLAYRALGDLGAAEGSLMEALEVEPGSTLASWLLAFCYRYTDRIDEAVALAETAADAAGRHPTYLAMAGYMYAAAGRTDDARAIVEEVDAFASRGYVSPLSRMLLNTALGDMEQLAAAIQDLRAHGGGVAPIHATNRPDLVELRDHPVVGPGIRELPIWRPPRTDAG